MEKNSHEMLIEIKGIVERWRGPLGLRDWRLEVKYGGVHSVTIADAEYSAGARAGVLRVQENWRGHADAFNYPLEENVLHELVHLLIADKFEGDDPMGDWLSDRFAAVLINARNAGGADG